MSDTAPQPLPPVRRKLVTIEEAAEYLGVSPLTIRRRVASGDLRGFRIGPRIVRVDLAEVDGLLKPIPTTGGAA